MIDETSNIWESDMVSPMSEVVASTIEAIKNPPKELTVTVTLRGVGAARYNFVRAIIQKTFGVGDEDIAGYILRAGAEREIERLAAVFPKTEELGEEIGK